MLGSYAGVSQSKVDLLNEQILKLWSWASELASSREDLE